MNTCTESIFATRKEAELAVACGVKDVFEKWDSHAQELSWGVFGERDLWLSPDCRFERVELEPSPCTPSVFDSIARKLNALGVTIHREGEVEYPDGTVAFKSDAALIYTDGGVDYRVVKTVHGYQVRTGGAIVARGEDEYDVDVLVSDIYRAVIGTYLFPLADWQQEVARGDTERGYRDWVEAKVGEEAHDRLVTTKPRFEQCHECGEHFVPSDFDFAPVGGGVLPAGERNSDGELWVQCPAGHRGMWTK